eukprot:5170332-Amphidinium_carterae.1
MSHLPERIRLIINNDVAEVIRKEAVESIWLTIRAKATKPHPVASSGILHRNMERKNSRTDNQPLWLPPKQKDS